jgi:hypothetical protein
MMGTAECYIEPVTLTLDGVKGSRIRLAAVITEYIALKIFKIVHEVRDDGLSVDST